MTHREKNQSIKMILELTQLLELADINIKMCFIIVCNMFKNLSIGMEHIKRTEVKLLEMRTTMPVIENIGIADQILQKKKK